MGGNGYTVEIRDGASGPQALAPPIYGGANEVQRHHRQEPRPVSI